MEVTIFRSQSHLPGGSMFEMARPAADLTKADLYHELGLQLTALVEGERDFIANAANSSALLFHGLPDLNWAGFYLMRGEGLVLGPFQGKPACIRIAVGQGVCGTAVAQRKSIVVPDVQAFPGHIACDSASRSELVVPLFEGSRVIGVLDLDSPEPARFDEQDRLGCETLAGILLQGSDPF
jgi:L-methionine (R)-S-oxide reductase